ncbi:hypothetical protein [Pseudomonas sp. NPDC089734]|uniref:hypothetical protein n=1 Tax=Pseudomonas sp. NPDC089734 TaxID=3364469 RepID=UPI00381E71AE
MSLNALHGSMSGQFFNASLANEMQREDFLALAAALRQFHFDEPQGAMINAETHCGDDHRAAVIA